MVVINCDMGEAYGLYKMGDDKALMPHIDVANVALFRSTCRCARVSPSKNAVMNCVPSAQR